MGDAPLMGRPQGQGRLPGVLERQFDRQGPHLIHQPMQVTPLHELLDDERSIVPGPGVQDRHEVAVLNQRCGLKPRQVSRRRIARGQPVGAEDLERYRLLQCRVQGLVRWPSGTVLDLVEDAVSTDGQPTPMSGPEFAHLERGEPALPLGISAERGHVAGGRLRPGGQLGDASVVQQPARAKAFKELTRPGVGHQQPWVGVRRADQGVFDEPGRASAIAGSPPGTRARWRKARQANDRTTIPVAQRTMVGPVGTVRPTALSRWLRADPPAPASAPNSPARSVITPSRSVHCRAAAAGATTRALIKTTPTLSNPITIDRTNRPVSKMSRATTGSPSPAAKSRSNVRSFNSFQNSPSSVRASAPAPAITQMSRGKSVAACPNR